MTVPQITLDTNLLLEYWKDQKRRAVIERLIELSRRELVELVVTARIREDVPRFPLSEKIDQLSDLNVQEGPSITRLGCWVLDRDVLADDSFVEVSERVDDELRHRGRNPPDWRDWDHLHAHFLSGRSVFLTWDERILEAAAALQVELGIDVNTPEGWLVQSGFGAFA